MNYPQSGKGDDGCCAGCLIAIGATVAMFLLIGLFSGGSGSSSEKMDAFVMSQRFIEGKLKSPGSASFASYNNSSVVDQGDGSFRVSSYVDAQNSFGAKIRARWTATVRLKHGETWELLDYYIDQ
jgi:hypothetical protein